MVVPDQRLPDSEKDRKRSFLTKKIEVGGSHTVEDFITRLLNEIDRHGGCI